MVVAVCRRGVRYFKGFGRAGAPAGDTLNDRTIFEIGSVTKAFTGIVLAKLVVDGSVQLDDPISLYLPEGVAGPKKFGREITLKDLAVHTSGLPRLPDGFLAAVKNPQNPYADYTTRNLYDDLGRATLKTEPGKQSVYSNFGYALLGKLLELKSRKSYETLIRELLCDPLAMSNTTTRLSEEQKRFLTPGHGPNGVVVPGWDQDAMAPAGAIRSDAEDMLKLIEANFTTNESAISKALQEACTLRFSETGSAVNGLGLGWRIEALSPDNGPVVHWRNGGTGGYVCFVGFDKQQQTGVVVLSNYGDAFSRDASVDRIGKELLANSSSASLGQL